MKTLFSSILRGALLGALTLSVHASTDQGEANDRAAELLATHGSVAVSSATRYVERGTYRIQVAAKLGRADEMLPDGTWLYHRRRLAQSDAVGTLVVRFNAGRVSSMALVTPAVATAMIETARSAKPDQMLATK